jgi:hypothetical protein
MRKLLLLFLAIVATSCSHSNDSVNNTNSSYINPPTWIQGTWIQEGSTVGNGYIFTTNDFLLKNQTAGNTSFKQSIETTNSTGGNASATEEITTTIYNISITIGAQTYVYNFQKVSATKIEWINDPLGSSVHTYYNKQ